MRKTLEWVVTIAVAVAFVLVFEAEVAKPFKVPSSSMEPTLRCARPARGCSARFSDRVIAARIVYRFREPRRGEIVVFRTPATAAGACGVERGSTFVKRVIGLPGETVSEAHGVVRIDGHVLREPYVPRDERDDRTQSWPQIPAGHYFMMGDNRAESCDSRSWGTVPRANLIGPVVATYWPPKRLSTH